ncbi:MAG TPA: malto-oligosyltrehalose synthase [Nitrospiraceae bacterium]|nr:malto-oligosyltrehalose synthase [Nitrospiraceae bacterium]
MTAPSTEQVPAATYRLQLNRSFPFDQARRLVPYLHAFGITDCYVSSFLQAMPGSNHGYDVIDPSRLNPEIGTEAEFAAFVEALRAHDMGLILDVVPNHMGIGKALNAWWRDVLENGPSSRYADAFDIDWHPIKRELDNKVLLPILGDQYGTVLENQELQIKFADGVFQLQYADHVLPLAPKSWLHLLEHDVDRLANTQDPQVIELHSIMTALRHLPSQHERDADKVAERYREKEVIKRRLAALVEQYSDIREYIEENVRRFNGRKGEPHSFDLLDKVLNGQSYRLASWKVASEEINYRRFFDINDLAAIRMEDPRMFEEVHRFVLSLVENRQVTGLRIDHVDGLYDPGAYLRQLQSWARDHLVRTLPDPARPLFIVVEKILGANEPLPDNWPVHGTTGYEFMNLVNGLYVDRRHERQFTDLYERFTKRRQSYDDLVYESKNLIMRMSMASDVNVLGHRLNLLSERDRRSRDFTLNNLTDALREVIACFPVYRTYITEGDEPILERDRAYIHMAVARAKRRNPALSAQVFDFIRAILLKQADARTEKDRADQLWLIMKFQQITGPVTAKGIEDTVFYVYNRLVSLNEVGGSPDQFGMALETFHQRMEDRQQQWPLSLSASSTHDTKRSEDVRARINILSEFPARWRECVIRWSKLNKKHRTDVEGFSAPDRNDEYLLYQTLVGCWPLTEMNEEEHRTLVERVAGYMKKAIYEAKLHTSWINPHQGYDEAVSTFVHAVMARNRDNAFLADFIPFQAEMVEYGLYNALSQLMVKITAPGIPDFYQGTELWDFSLVDPDNRRPVDYVRRAKVLDEMRQAVQAAGRDRRALLDGLLRDKVDGRIKFYIAWMGLEFRKRHRRLFMEGRYVPLRAGGPCADHVCAFARLLNEEGAVVITPRLLGSLLPNSGTPPLGADVWRDTWISLRDDHPVKGYRNILSGEEIVPRMIEGGPALRLHEGLSHCPVALLEPVR